MRICAPIFLSVIAVCAVPFAVSAHEPDYVGAAVEIAIPDPTTSRAYYGELTGKPATYTITFATTTNFYLNILAPNIPGARTDFDVTMRDANGAVVLELLHGTPWEPWYEEFAGDTYLKGSEERKDISAGTYTITVDNRSHAGKYVLAPGEAELFTIGGTPETIRQIYRVKTQFFDKPPYSIFEGIVGKGLLGITIGLVALIFFGILFFRRNRRNSGENV